MRLPPDAGLLAVERCVEEGLIRECRAYNQKKPLITGALLGTPQPCHGLCFGQPGITPAVSLPLSYDVPLFRHHVRRLVVNGCMSARLPVLLPLI